MIICKKIEKNKNLKQEILNTVINNTIKYPQTRMDMSFETQRTEERVEKKSITLPWYVPGYPFNPAAFGLRFSDWDLMDLRDFMFLLAEHIRKVTSGGQISYRHVTLDYQNKIVDIPRSMYLIQKYFSTTDRDNSWEPVAMEARVIVEAISTIIPGVKEDTMGKTVENIIRRHKEMEPLRELNRIGCKGVHLGKKERMTSRITKDEAVQILNNVYHVIKCLRNILINEYREEALVAANELVVLRSRLTQERLDSRSISMCKKKSCADEAKAFDENGRPNGKEGCTKMGCPYLHIGHADFNFEEAKRSLEAIKGKKSKKAGAGIVQVNEGAGGVGVIEGAPDVSRKLPKKLIFNSEDEQSEDAADSDVSMGALSDCCSDSNCMHKLPVGHFSVERTLTRHKDRIRETGKLIASRIAREFSLIEPGAGDILSSESGAGGFRTSESGVSDLRLSDSGSSDLRTSVSSVESVDSVVSDESVTNRSSMLIDYDVSRYPISGYITPNSSPDSSPGISPVVTPERNTQRMRMNAYPSYLPRRLFELESPAGTEKVGLISQAEPIDYRVLESSLKGTTYKICNGCSTLLSQPGIKFCYNCGYNLQLSL